MALGFTIPAGYVSTNNPLSNMEVRPDRGMSRKAKSRIRIAKFGDGYEQRIADGINNVEEAYSVKFSNRSKEVIDDIAYFFETKKATAFDFTIPDSNNSGETTIKVVVGDYTLNYDNHPVTYSISTTFRRVYEA
jgi:phage-related protein